MFVVICDREIGECDTFLDLRLYSSILNIAEAAASVYLTLPLKLLNGAYERAQAAFKRAKKKVKRNV